MLKRVVVILCFTVASLSAYSQYIVLHDKDAILPEEEAIDILSSARPVVEDIYSDSIHFFKADVFHFNNRSLLTIPGLFDVYEYKDGAWINLYNRPFLGYNFGSFKFLYNNSIHSIGGYGYWKTIGEVIIFNETFGEWSLIKGSKDLPYGIVFPMKEHLVILGETAVYKFNLSDNTIDTYPPSDAIRMHKVLRGRFLNDIYDAENYTLLLLDTIFLVDKINEQVFIDRSRYPWSIWMDRDSLNLHIYKDIIAVYDYNFKPITKIPININKQSSSLLWEASNTGDNFGFKWLLTAVLLLTFFITGFIMWRRKRSNWNSNSFDHPIMIKLHEFDGVKVSAEELDILFEIPTFLSNEAQRLRRAQIIKELNTIHKKQTGKDLILRSRDIKDQRRFIYKISFAD